MEPNHKTLPPSLVEMNSGFDYSAESRAPQMPEMQQQPKISPSPQTPAMKSPPRPIVKAMILTTRADWVNTLWVDISSQLRRLSVISDDLFDGLLLKRNTFTGSVILRELVSIVLCPICQSKPLGMLMLCAQRKKYEELGDDRNLATVRVVAPETLMGEVWRLLWTIKRHRDPNGRKTSPPSRRTAS